MGKQVFARAKRPEESLASTLAEEAKFAAQNAANGNEWFEGGKQRQLQGKQAKVGC